MADLYSAADQPVTGEAVSLDLPPAALGLRIASGALDALISALAIIPGLWLTVLVATDEATIAVGSILTLVGALIVLPVTVETLSRGRSVGKLATGLRTVRDDAGPIAFGHAFTRALIGLVEIWILSAVPAVICALVSPQGKRLGDYAAGTYVVRARYQLILPPPAPMPPPLAAWARHADIAPLPERLLLSARQLLGRTESLAPQSHHLLVGQLAAEFGRHVAPPPPPGTPPEAFLAAVVAEHRERNRARMAGEAAMIARLSAAAHADRS